MKVKSASVFWVLSAVSAAVFAQGVSRLAPGAQPSGQAGQVQTAPPANNPFGSGASFPSPNVVNSSALPPSPIRAGQPMPSPMQERPKQDLVNETIDRVAPLSPEEVMRLRRELDSRSNALTENIKTPPKPVSRVIRLDMSPGTAPEVVRIAPGEGTVVSFVDAAGKPWPLAEGASFNGEAVDVQKFGENGLSIGMKQNNRVGNAVVLLADLPSPISFSIVPGQREVDYSVQMTVPRYRSGTMDLVGSVSGQPQFNGPELLNYLLKTPPSSAQKLTVENLPGALAWQITPSRMVLRTDATVANPAWFRKQSSGDGMSVYELPLSPVVLVTVGGRYVSAKVQGFGLKP